MYQQQFQNDRSSWMKWGILIGGLVTILVVLLIGYLYVSVMNEKSKDYSKAEQRAFDETDLLEVEQVERFHGEEAYFVVSGIDANEEPIFVFVPFDQEEATITIDQPSSYTKSIVKQSWEEKCSTCKLTSITPGLIDETAVWEINYRLDKDIRMYEYISMEDGSIFEQLQLKKMFK